MDRRRTPANDRIAASELRGTVPSAEYTDGWTMCIGDPVVDLRQSARGSRDRQLQLGAVVQVFEDHKGWSFVRAHADGYVGYVPVDTLKAYVQPTHRVGSFATHAYLEPDMKSPDVMSLRFGAQLSVLDERKTFFETNIGFVPKRHLRPLDRPFSDPATIAQLHFGVPYLWGGNTTLGIDCSGLVQAALTTCDIPCPGDSDMQCAEVIGTDIARSNITRGDLVFWDGHVAMAVDDQTLIHANAHHMAVAYEPINAAITRISAQGDGSPTRLMRL